MVNEAKSHDSWQKLLEHQRHEIDFKQNTSLNYFDDGLYKNWLVKACRHYYSKISTANNLQQAFEILESFRILLPTRVGERGVEQVNKTIEYLLQQDNKTIRSEKNYSGRPIMVTQNSYNNNLFNGDIGLLWKNKQGQLTAWFEQEEIKPNTDSSTTTEDKQKKHYRNISLARLPAVETVYAMTIHKTQGSEFDHVAIVLPQQNSKTLSPELLYTGLTRAKNQLSIITNHSVWEHALNNRSWRYSGLKERWQGKE